MNTFTKHSLATAAVTGLIVVGGASAASAEDSQQQDRQESVLGGPIELGGLQLGSEQDSSSSSASSSSDSDDEGRESRRTTERDSSSRDVGLDTGDVRLDPRASSLQEGSSTSEDDGEDTTSRSSTDLAGNLGLEIDGASGFVREDTSSAAGAGSTDDDEDGTAAEQTSSEQERSAAGGFDTGGLELRPGGSFSSDSAWASEDDGEEGAQQQRSVLDLSAPFRYEGGTYVVDFFSSESQQDQSTEVDEDGDAETDQSTSEEERSETFGGRLEGGQGDPGLTLDSEDFQAQDD